MILIPKMILDLYFPNNNNILNLKLKIRWMKIQNHEKSYYKKVTGPAMYFDFSYI